MCTCHHEKTSEREQETKGILRRPSWSRAVQSKIFEPSSLVDNSAPSERKPKNWQEVGIDRQVPAPFTYERASSVDEAIGLFERRGGSARLLAGGHSLLPMMKLRLASFDYLIDINDLQRELGYVIVEPSHAPLVGAMAAALPYCDDFLPAHTVRALGEAMSSIARAR
jgi:hypothetical protein